MAQWNDKLATCKTRKYIKNTARFVRCFLGYDRKFSTVIFVSRRLRVNFAGPNFMRLFASRRLCGFFAEHSFLLEYHKHDCHDRNHYDRYGDTDGKSHYHAVILFFDIDGGYLA